MSTPTDRTPDRHGDHPHLTGRQVVDEHGEPLGSVDDVLFNALDETPEFFVVKPGLLRRAHYLPVRGSYESADGDIVVPWDQRWFKHSPPASRDHVLTPDDRRQVEAHYADR